MTSNEINRLVPKIPPKFGVSFSPSGLMTAFQIGASAQLREYGLINPSVALAGSSGGSLVALSCALDIPAAKMLNFVNAMARECRDKGTRNTIGHELKNMLDIAVPENAHEILNSRLTTFTLGYSEIYPTRTAHFINVFHSKEDIVSTVAASCNIPFYSAGNVFTVNARDGLAIDGIFTTDRARFGCPDTGATEHEIIICPYPANVVGLDPRKSRYSVHRDTCTYSLITPDLLTEKYGEAVPENESETEADALSGVETEGTTAAGGGGHSRGHNRDMGVDSAGGDDDDSDSDGGGAGGHGGLYSTIISKLYKAAKSTATGVSASGGSATLSYNNVLKLLNRESKNKIWPFSLLDVVTMTFGPPASTNIFSRLFGKKISDSELASKYDIMFKAGQEAVRIWYSLHPIPVEETLIHSASTATTAVGIASEGGQSGDVDSNNNSSGSESGRSVVDNISADGYSNSNSSRSGDGTDRSDGFGTSYSEGVRDATHQPPQPQQQPLQDVSIGIELSNDGDRISSRGHPFI